MNKGGFHMRTNHWTHRLWIIVAMALVSESARAQEAAEEPPDTPTAEAVDTRTPVVEEPVVTATPPPSVWAMVAASSGAWTARPAGG